MEDYPHGENESTVNRPTDFDFNVPSFQSMGDVVGAVFRLYRDNFVSLFKIVVVLSVPLVVAQYAFLYTSQLPWAGAVTFIFSSVAGSLMSGTLIYAVARFLRSGAFPSLADSYRWGFKMWGRVILCNFLFGIVVALGLAALIIPGIIFSLMFALVIPVVVLENTTTTDSFTRSKELTKNYRWQIFFTYFLFSLIIIVISIVTTGLGGAAGAESSLPFAIVQGLITQLLESASIVLTLFIYLGILKDLKQLPPQDHHDTYTRRSDDWASASQVETGREY